MIAPVEQRDGTKERKKEVEMIDLCLTPKAPYKAQVAQTARPKVPMHRLGADCFVVVMKRGNARGAKGAGHRHLARVNRQREEPDVQWKAAAFMRWHEPYDARVSSPVL
jgi:hypothetical protein